MNPSLFRKFLPAATFAAGFILTAAVWAGEPADPEPTPALPPEPPAIETPVAEDPVEVPVEAPELRRLDTAAPAEPAVETVAVSAEDEPEATLAKPTDEAEPKAEKRTHRVRVRSGSEFPFGGNTVATGNTVSYVVSILGSSVVDGAVEREAVSIMGSTRVNGSVGREAVAVMGDVHVEGSVGREVVAVLGDVYINGPVGNEVVAVMGDVTLGADAVIGRDLVVVGGRLTRDPAAVVNGNVKVVTLPIIGSGFAPFKTWIKRCLLLGRPLAFGENLGWAWMIAIGVFAFYVLLALLFPRAFEKCAETLEQRPGHSLLAVLLSVLILPVLIVLLAITGVGVLLIPFIAAGLFFAGIFGKAVMHAWLGRRLTRYFGPGPASHVAVATLIGGALVLLLYTIPFFGFFLAKALEVVGLGVVIYTLILSMRREKPAAPTPAPASGPQPAAGFTAAVVPPALPVPAAGGSEAAVMPPPIPAPVAAALLPRAGFWIRIAASAIDAVLIGMLASFVNLSGAFPLLFAAYCVLLWSLKGTTVGGIVCNLRVVRLDDRPVDWTIGIVRALGGFLSLFVAGLGFIWVAFDPERQSWHDKIAGTTIVRMPKGTPLI
ncbi:MAG: hypothetical protein RLZZ129_1909 [Verrucomicrobiota bacterium]|jgi:uncharacterized RDD family membrane protein YckC